MKFLYTLDELLAISTNGWSCEDCGRLWLDTVGPSVAFPLNDGDSTCPHTKLIRARITQ